MDGAFEGVCAEFLSLTEISPPEPIYNAVLIDEAQDLPASFFEVVRKMLRPPNRIVLAYDELQKLSESALPTIDEQFGKDAQGEPIGKLVNSPDAPHQDIILPICYRNTPWALALAHGLGLGTSREAGLVQSFDEPSLWIDIGYKVAGGSQNLQKGSTVTLERGPSSFPSYFLDLLTQEDAVSSHVFRDAEEQASWVAKNIKQNLDEDELEHDDILIVLPNAYTAKSEAITMLRALNKVGINGHLAGVTTSQDEIFKSDSIAIANIHRSKGNESPMVYILNSQFCVKGPELTMRRNILFTAITRSKAWVRLCGWGPLMEELQSEIQSIQSNNYMLTMRIPTDDELDKMRRIHQDLTTSQEGVVREAEKGLRFFVEALEHGQISMSDLPLPLKTAIAKHFRGPHSDSE